LNLNVVKMIPNPYKFLESLLEEESIEYRQYIRREKHIRDRYQQRLEE